MGIRIPGPTLRRQDAKLFFKMNSDIQEILREIRKEFFAFRNGIVADKLRKAGDPHGMIMGCLLVDVQAIAARARESIGETEQLVAIANELWADTKSRECRLAAPMLYPAEEMNLDQAVQWCESVETIEVADNLCHKLLRHIADAYFLFRQLIVDDRPLLKYTGYRLLLNLLLLNKVQPTIQLKAFVKSERAQGPLAVLLKDIIEEF